MKPDKKQTRKFRLRDIVFFNKDKGGNMLKLGGRSMDQEIMDTEGATLRLMNDKSGYKIHTYTMKQMGNNI